MIVERPARASWMASAVPQAPEPKTAMGSFASMDFA